MFPSLPQSLIADAPMAHGQSSGRRNSPLSKVIALSVNEVPAENLSQVLFASAETGCEKTFLVLAPALGQALVVASQAAVLLKQCR